MAKPGRKPIDPLLDPMVGREFGRLKVIRNTGERTKDRRAIYFCKCECGNTAKVIGRLLLKGLTKSCGCLARETTKANRTTHGKYKTSEYRIWKSMLTRCRNPNSDYYKDYGGRGITVCERWESDFALFYEDMGARPSGKHSIDRRDNDLGYSPDNCYWATGREQALNRRPKRKS